MSLLGQILSILRLDCSPGLSIRRIRRGTAPLRQVLKLDNPIATPIVNPSASQVTLPPQNLLLPSQILNRETESACPDLDLFPRSATGLAIHDRTKRKHRELGKHGGSKPRESVIDGSDIK